MSIYQRVLFFIHQLSQCKSLWIFLLAMLVLPFLLLAFVNHPCADDFCYAHSVRVNDFWAMQTHWYNQANGRYASTFFITFNPLMIGSIMGYKLVMLLLLLVFSIAVVFLVKKLLGKTVFDVSVWAVSFFFLLMFIVHMASIAEGFYWLSGVMTYQLVNISFVFLLLILLHIERTKNKYLLLLAASVLCFIISGSNETGMLELLYLLVALSAIEWINHKKIPLHYLVLLVVTVIGITILVVAPGNTARAAYFTGNKQVVHSIFSAIGASAQILLQWLPDVLMLTVLFFTFLKEVQLPGFSDRQVPTWLVALYPLFLFGILVIGFFPAFWGMNSWPPPRSVNALLFLFLLAYLYFILLLLTYTKQRYQLVEVPGYAKFILAFIFFTHIYAKNNIRTAYMDLVSGRAVTYNREMNSRYTAMAQSTTREVVLPPLTLPPSSVFLDDVEANPDDWKNKCTSDYFRLKSLRLKASTYEQ